MVFREEQLPRDVFFSPRRQGRKDLDVRTYSLIARCHPVTPLPTSLRSLCALCGFAREEQLPRDIFSPSRQGRKDLDARTYPLIARCQPVAPMPTPLRSPCEAFAPSAALRGKGYCRGIFFRQAAKAAKEKHEIFAAAFHGLCFFSSDSSRLSTTYARCRSLSADYALRVHSDPLAECGPCGRPPWQGNQFPFRGADGHKGRAMQMTDTTHERPKDPPCSRRAAELIAPQR